MGTDKAEEKLDDIEDLLRADRIGCAESLSNSLLQWYDINRRLLPWRGDKTRCNRPKSDVKVKEEGEEEEEECDGENKKRKKGKTKKNKKEERPKTQSLAEFSEEDRAQIESERQPVSPYETWVSEIMLQQTRVETVIDYFNRWTKAFPTVEALAKASEDEVNSLWAGLGYYRRAKNLHKGAKKVADEMKGVMPSDVKGLLTIPGIGEYTAGAIASIAFRRAVPLVDGNVIRVFSRLCAVRADVKDKALVKGCWSLARELVPSTRPGDFNQALMELGATVCTPQAPKCEKCPVQAFCIAYKSDPTSVTQYPIKTKSKELPEQTFAISVVSRVKAPQGRKRTSGEKEYLLVKRPDQGLLAGQWEFLSVLMEPQVDLETRLSIVDSRLASDHSLKPHAPCQECLREAERKDHGSFTHTFSHLRHNLHVESVVIKRESCKRCRTSNEEVEEQNRVAWMTQEEMDRVGLTKSMKTCLEMALGKPGKKKAKKEEKEDKKQTRLTAFMKKT